MSATIIVVNSTSIAAVVVATLILGATAEKLGEWIGGAVARFWYAMRAR